MNLSWLPDALLAVHLLAATVWVGGMFYALVVLRPRSRCWSRERGYNCICRR